jgi:hypothetical protein
LDARKKGVKHLSEQKGKALVEEHDQCFAPTFNL